MLQASPPPCAARHELTEAGMRLSMDTEAAQQRVM
jgi:hypothetical protein